MARTEVHLFVTGPTVTVAFPSRCIYCMEPAEANKSILVSGSKTMGKTKYTSRLKLAVPYCRKHQRQDRRISLVKLGVILLVMLASAIVTSIWLKPIDTSTVLLTILAAVFYAILGGACIGIPLLCLVNLIAMIFSKPWRDSPFALGQGSLGFMPKMQMAGGRGVSASSLVLKFTDPDYANAFVQANPGAIKRR